MGKFLIVDAHSVIFSWPELRSLHGRRMALAREALVKILTAYQDASGTRVVAVFDGQGSKASEESEPGGIQIFYSAQGQTADAVVERLVARYASQHDITVATSDHLEQETVASFGANPISTELLRMVIEQSSDDFQREMAKYRRR